MPAGNNTGPLGQGPGTGRGLGFCAGYDSPGYTKGFGSGMGRRFRFRGGAVGNHVFGGGSGFRHGFGWRHNNAGAYFSSDAYNNQEDEISALKSQSQNLKRTLEYIEKRLGELEADKSRT